MASSDKSTLTASRKTDAPSPRKRDAGQTRNRILDAAESVLRRDGAARLTIDSVAQEAGLSKGGVLYHFSTKELMLTALLVRISEGMDISAYVSDDDIANPFLRAWFRKDHEKFSGDDDLPRALIAAAAEWPSLMETPRAQFAENLAKIQGESSDPDLSMLLLFSAYGLAFTRLLGMNPLSQHDLERLKARLDALAGDATLFSDAHSATRRTD